jgi:hypothetical protein
MKRSNNGNYWRHKINCAKESNCFLTDPDTMPNSIEIRCFEIDCCARNETVTSEIHAVSGIRIHDIADAMRTTFI